MVPHPREFAMPRAGLVVGRLMSALGRGESWPSGGLTEEGGRVGKQMGRKVICNACVVRNHTLGAVLGGERDFSEF